MNSSVEYLCYLRRGVYGRRFEVETNQTNSEARAKEIGSLGCGVASKEIGSSGCGVASPKNEIGSSGCGVASPKSEIGSLGCGVASPKSKKC
jgi:hypothetical protein